MLMCVIEFNIYGGTDMTTFTKNHTYIVLFALIAIVTAFIWGNSMLDAEKSGNISKNVTEIVCEILGEKPDEVNMDKANFTVRKIAHFSEFLLLGVLYSLVKFKIDGKSFSLLIFLPLFCTLLTAVADEFIQSFTGRGSMVSDVLIDFSGATVGTLSAHTVCHILHKRQHS